MATPRDKYYTELCRTITYYNDHNGAPFSNEKIPDVINRFILEEESDPHNVPLETFSQTPVTPNIQGENENTVLISGKRNNLDVLT